MSIREIQTITDNGEVIAMIERAAPDAGSGEAFPIARLESELLEASELLEPTIGHGVGILCVAEAVRVVLWQLAEINARLHAACLEANGGREADAARLRGALDTIYVLCETMKGLAGCVGSHDWLRDTIIRVGNIAQAAMTQDGEKGMSDLYEQLSRSHPKLTRGQVWCRTCNHTQRVNSASALRSGWPRHCGYTMTLDSPEEQQEEVSE